MKLVALYSLLVLSCTFLHAQQTANYINNWYFGTNVGISFNSGSPVNITSNITGYEVTASFSDGLGNPLFYSGAISPTSNGNGYTVWDASNTTMPNGDVSVNYSQSCGLTAVPVPGNCDQYYLFALAVIGGTNYGLRYSVVDMTLPGNGTIPSPLGDIDPAQKDVLVFSADTLAEKIKVVQKGTTEDYWIITRSLNNDLFYSFEVTSSGVNPIPVISVISATNWPTAIGSPIFSWLAINKDRNIIAEANGFGPDAKVFGFDNMTGILTPGETIIPTGTFGSDIEYGIEFSPSGDVLYVNWLQGGANTYISSFDMTVGFGAIGATRQDYLIAVGPAEYGALVKAPDGKIYGTRTSTTQLTVINTPENYLAPTIVSPGFDPSPGVADIGMPNITYYYHPDNFIDTLAGGDRIICPTEQATIGAIGTDSIWSTYSWEPSAMVIDPNNAVTQTIALAADQQFILHTIRQCGDTIKSDTVFVSVTCAALPVELLNFTVEKRNDQVELNWSTITEINNDKFIVQRSQDGIDFNTIATLQGAGNSQSKINYKFIDRNPIKGLNYYRLKQIDFDGAWEYSNVRAVSFDLNSTLQLYPNPTKDHITLKSDDFEIAEVFLLSNAGKLLIQEQYNTTKVLNINVQHLESGIYWIRALSTTGEVYYLKFTKI